MTWFVKAFLKASLAWLALGVTLLSLLAAGLIVFRRFRWSRQ